MRTFTLTLPALALAFTALAQTSNNLARGAAIWRRSWTMKAWDCAWSRHGETS